MSLKEAEKSEVSYVFGDCEVEYHRRVLGFPPRSSDMNPIRCIKCSEEIEECVVRQFKNSNQSLISLYLV